MIDEGPAAARARHRVRRQQVAAGQRAGRGRVGAQVPAAGPRRRRLRDRQADGAGRRAHRRALPEQGVPRGEGPRRGGDVAGGARPDRRRGRGRRHGVARREGDLRPLHDRGRPAAHARQRGLPHRRRASRSPTTRSSCWRASPPVRAIPTRRRRCATTAGAWNGCWATPAIPAASVDPDVNRSGDKVSLTWVLKLGAAGSHRSDLRPRQLQDHARDDPGADPAQVGRLPDDHGGRARPAQPRLPAAVQQRDADLVPGPGREPRGGPDGGRGRGALRAIQRRSTRAPACRPTRSRPISALPFGVYVRVGYENRNFWGHGWSAAANLTYGTALLRGDLTLSRPPLPRDAVPLQHHAQLPAAGDRPPRRHPLGRRIDRLFARDVSRASTPAFTTTCATPPTPSR